MEKLGIFSRIARRPASYSPSPLLLFRLPCARRIFQRGHGLAQSPSSNRPYTGGGAPRLIASNL